MTRIDLSGAAWRKSSYSNSTGGSCVEVAAARWQKSSHSNGQGGSCVEVATFGTVVGMRDSKDATGPALQFASDDFHTFVTAVKSDTLR